MKKIHVFVVLMVLFSGCQRHQEENVSNSEYGEYIKRLHSQHTFINSTDEFNVKVIRNMKNENAYRYDVIIDNPQIEMHNIKAVAQIPAVVGYSYPSIGILEEERFSLIPNVIDKENNIYKGINLSGISPYQDTTIYVYITFYSSTDDDRKRIERYMEVN